MTSFKNLISENLSEMYKKYNQSLSEGLSKKAKDKIVAFLKDPKISKDKKKSLLIKMKEMGVNIDNLLKKESAGMATGQHGTKGKSTTWLAEQGVNKDKRIAELRSDIEKIKGLFEYELNKYEIQLAGLQSGIASKLQRDLKMELDGLTLVADRLDPEDGRSLKMSISNINQFLDMLKKSPPLTQITEQSEDKDKLIAELEAELKELEDLLRYKEVYYKKQLTGLKSNILSKLENTMNLELEKLTSLADRLNPEDSRGLKMSISNIYQLLSMIKK